MRWLLTSISVISLCVVPLTGCSDGEDMSPQAALINGYLDSYIEEHLSPDGPGFALAVLGPGNQVVLNRAFGMANRDEGLSIGTDSLYGPQAVGNPVTSRRVRDGSPSPRRNSRAIFRVRVRNPSAISWTAMLLSRGTQSARLRTDRESHDVSRWAERQPVTYAAPVDETLR